MDKTSRQYSLRQILTVTAVIALCLGFAASYLTRRKARRDLDAAVAELGGEVVEYDGSPLRGYWIELNGTKTDDRQLQWLSQTIQRFGSVTMINLDDTRVTDVGLESLTRVKGLVGISLKNTAVSDDGIRWLEQIPTLRSIDLEGSRVSDQRYERLWRTLPSMNE